MTRNRPPSASLCVLAAIAFPLGALAQASRVGSEFQVNTFVTNGQRHPALAADADGDFVIVWESFSQDGPSYGVFAARFSSAGAVLASEFQVNSYTSDNQASPSLAADADGDFVVAWDSEGQDGQNAGVFARRFSSAGVSLASEFQVNAYTTSAQRAASVATDDDGDFVVAWESQSQDRSNYGIFARLFSSAGAALATEFQVNSYTPGSQRYPSVDRDADGDFVVAWMSYGQDRSNYGIFARLFSSAGAAQASEFQVNAYTIGSQRFPSVGADSGGDFVVAWQSDGQDGSNNGVFARRFSSAGVSLAGEFQVNTRTSAPQGYPSVSTEPDGDFVVAWESVGQDGALNGVFARRFSSAGSALTGEFQVNTFTISYEGSPSVGTAADGDFVVAWESYAQDGSAHGVFAQRFAVLATLDIDGDGGLGALTDGLLVLRRLFGFTGSTLITGAVGGGCSRCDATSIEAYIAALGLTLDIDGTGDLGALTDGLLVLRFLFGFTGATLTSGAVGGGCSRCDAAAIEPYLAGLT